MRNAQLVNMSGKSDLSKLSSIAQGRKNYICLNNINSWIFLGLSTWFALFFMALLNVSSFKKKEQPSPLTAKGKCRHFIGWTDF